MTFKIRFLGALCAVFVSAGAYAADDRQVNALLVIPSDKTAFDGNFQDFLDKKGAKLLNSYPPSVFVGYIPAALDAELGEKYGARVYRDRVEDWSSFARYGEGAVFAVNSWNKRFVEDPPEAPLVVSLDVRKAGRGPGLDLSWNEVMKAVSYRLQISTEQAFGSLVLETGLTRNTFRVFPAFWNDGVYYWRVAGLLTLNNGETREGAFSEPYSFAVSRQAGPAASKPPAPALRPAAKYTGTRLTWYPGGAKYYRLQLSRTGDFDTTFADVFTDTCSVKISELPVNRGERYYMRVMASDGTSAGDWSAVSRIIVDPALKKRAAKQ